MIFIYNCYAGTHSSSLAAAVHLKKLPADRTPTKEEIIGTEYFDKLTAKDFGRLIYRGTDEEGNRVYTIGRGSSKLIVPSLVSLINVFCNDFGFSERIIFSNMSPTVNILMTIGGFVSRRLRLRFIGLPLLVAGARRTHGRIAGIVRHTRECAKTLTDQVLVLQNKK